MGCGCLKLYHYVITRSAKKTKTWKKGGMPPWNASKAILLN
jgi:hypothetical protein